MRGPLLAAALDMQAPILVSANAFSVWRNVPALTRATHAGLKTFDGYREWASFKHPCPKLIGSTPIHLDSAGFVAAVKYRGFPWPVDAYLDLCASAPWVWFASMDWCVEPQVAGSESLVFDRIAGTVRLNIECMRGAQERGIADRLMPVIQGWEPHHYLRCLDRMSGMLDGYKLLGVGSMCRRHVEGQRGILQIIDALDRALPPDVRLHLFGLKSSGLAEIRGHPRVASGDSQAYGVRARQLALEGKHSKTEVFVAEVMRRWYLQQVEQMARPGFVFREPTGVLSLLPPAPTGIEAFIARSEERTRQLHEEGECDWNDVNSMAAYYEMGMADDCDL